MELFLDCETTGLYPHKGNRIRCISWSVNGEEPKAIDIEKHTPNEFSELYECADYIGGHNVSFDIKFIQAQLGLVLKHGVQFIDTKIIYRYMDPHKSCKLKDLAERILKIDVIRLSDLQGKGKKKLGLDQIPTDDLLTYCKQDVLLSQKLYQKYKQDLIVKERLELMSA